MIKYRNASWSDYSDFLEFKAKSLGSYFDFVYYNSSQSSEFK